MNNTNVEMLDATGKQVLSASDGRVIEERADSIRAGVPITSPLLEGGQGTLVVQVHIPEYHDALRHTWLLWSAHFAVTVGVVSLFLAIAVYLQVTRPINRLLQGVKKMEMGYWAPVDIGGGAWEVRWLAWRFGNMAQEVMSSMTHLFEAQHRALSPVPRRTDVSSVANQPLAAGSDTRVLDPTDSSVYQSLIALCERLESASHDDPQALRLARGVWSQEAVEANRFGFHQVKARLEDAALHLIKPDTYARLDKRLSQLKATWGAWMEQHCVALRRMLERKAIPCVAVLCRVKHTAGIWAKMEGKGLGVDEVYDLFAFRIIVPTEADCYAALGVLHRDFRPEISRFKDYIARPKGNGYRSLHTCVRAGDGPIFEVQIRSVAMDRQAERGDAAHWLYKKNGRETPRKPVTPDWWDRIRRWKNDAA